MKRPGRTASAQGALSSTSDAASEAAADFRDCFMALMDVPSSRCALVSLRTTLSDVVLPEVVVLRTSVAFRLFSSAGRV